MADVFGRLIRDFGLAIGDWRWIRQTHQRFGIADFGLAMGDGSDKAHQRFWIADFRFWIRDGFDKAHLSVDEAGHKFWILDYGVRFRNVFIDATVIAVISSASFIKACKSCFIAQPLLASSSIQ